MRGSGRALLRQALLLPMLGGLAMEGSGCSLVFTRGPGLDRQPPEPCTPSNGYAIADTMLAAVSLAAIVGGSIAVAEGDAWWPWLVTAVVGTSVGVERVLAGRHFPTDVLVAGLAGTAVGVALPWLHARARFGGSRLMLRPAAGGVQLAWVGRW